MSIEARPKLPNEFLTSPDDNRIRPYTVGLKSHNETVASIVLYTLNSATGETQELENNYLADLNFNINNLIAGATKLGVNPTPDIPGGKVAMITLDEKKRNNYYGLFNNFSLMSVQEAHGEIVKIHQNFSDGWNAFFFGEKPVVYQFSGIFIDSMDYPYYQEFMVAYEKFLAGRKCVENGFQMKIMYDGRLVDGYMLNITVSRTAATPLTKEFTFTVLVTGTHWIRVNLIPTYDARSQSFILEEKFNGMSNLYRLNRLTDGIIDSNITKDTEGKTAPTEADTQLGDSIPNEIR